MDERPTCEIGTIKILQEKAGKKISLTSAAAISYLTHPQQARELKAKMNYWDLIKIKSSCTAKETVNKTKRQLIDWGKIFANENRIKG